MKDLEPHAGSITFVMLDPTKNQIVELGGAEFSTEEELNRAWNRLPEAPLGAYSVFLADLEDAEFNVLTNKPVTAEAIVERLRVPLPQLIARARLEDKAIANWVRPRPEPRSIQ